MTNILITGCSSGFGQRSALELARRGQRVFATMRDLTAAEPLTRAAQQEDLPLSLHRLDVTDSDSIESALQEINAEGEIDTLVNNAGQRGPLGPLTTFSDNDLTQTFDVNVLGVARMVRYVVPSMIARRSGTVVNISSMAGLVGAPFESAYSISKHGVEALSEALRWELAAHGVRVVVIEPGAYDTNFFGAARYPAAFADDHPERETFAWMTEAIDRTMITGRLQDPNEVVEAICAAALESDDTFRRVVGKDAQAITVLKRKLPFEQYEQEIRRIFGLDHGSGPASADSE
ncbi:SDR family oxidoreductase [Nocardia sp. NPDC051929]|uniref:SDR family oxidoreductase n=1 Tax=unclassified Nocardia TaxID=2637762 RepID=UPI00342FED4F